VSIFVTHDNTIISFFEMSAQDVESPIIRRLQTADTILRQSCDASMVGQAIIDAIIDLAIPVASCYGDVIGDMELDVLTRPDLVHTKNLYIIISEINKILSFISPIVNLVTALRDHKIEMSQDVALKELQNPLKGVIITPMTFTYLGDVLDHCLLITENMHQLKGAAEGMIDLIFNTISAYQNESMKQLTVATIIFLPLVSGAVLTVVSQLQVLITTRPADFHHRLLWAKLSTIR
jgi:Mg2+ and Co2+ transporter CorA